MTAPLAQPGQAIVSGPEKQGSERVWRLRLADGSSAVLGELLPELAREEPLRRRYVRDAERLAGLRAASLAPTLAIGPQPDPRDPLAAPPWRLRVEPPGITLESWLAARAPAAPDEAAGMAARLCDALAEVHAEGAVLRDLQPRQIVAGADRMWLAEVGLARVDLLSTRTASSLILEGSPYAAPEHLRASRVDARADLYSVGVILWRALTGMLPFGAGPALFRSEGLPAANMPKPLESLLARLLAATPEARPDTAREVAAALRGQAAPAKALARIACQGCGAAVPTGLRLCLACGGTAVQLVHVSAGGRALDLVKATEDAAVMARLRSTLSSVAQAPLPRLDFVTGDVRYYSKEERKGLHALPARLFTDLEPATAERLRGELTAAGCRMQVRDPARDRRIRRAAAVALATAPLWLLVAAATHHYLPAVFFAMFIQVLLGLVGLGRARRSKMPILRLREGPAALPAADPLVRRLAGLQAGAEPDVREQVGELALQVQNLVEHRARHAGARLDIEAVASPVAPLVAQVEKQVNGIKDLDRALAALDEGNMVRALAASEARREPRSARAALLEGLDRLRSLEDLRAAHMQRLLEASALLRRAVSTALAVADPEVEHQRDIDEALAVLSEDSP